MGCVLWGLFFCFTHSSQGTVKGWRCVLVVRWKEGQGEMDSLLQEAGDIIPAARRPYKWVGLHGDVSSHQFGRFLPTGATAVADPIMIHAKPRKHHQGIREMINYCVFNTSGSSTRRILQFLMAGTDQQEPFSMTATLRDSSGMVLTCGQSRGQW